MVILATLHGNGRKMVKDFWNTEENMLNGKLSAATVIHPCNAGMVLEDPRINNAFARWRK